MSSSAEKLTFTVRFYALTGFRPGTKSQYVPGDTQIVQKAD